MSGSIREAEKARFVAKLGPIVRFREEKRTPNGAQASLALWRCAEQRDERTSASITVVPSPVLDPANLWHSLH